MDIRAIAFDTGGTVLDWHRGLVQAFAGLAARRGLALDGPVLANEWRRRTMKGIVGQVRPTFHMDDVHREALDATLAQAGLDAVDAPDRQELLRRWHELDAWPGFVPALERLRQRLPVVSFTMLPLRLVIDVSRRNAIVWDAVISCQQIGVYKPHAEAYETACRWLDLPPSQVLMVACHNFDLNAAMAVGMRTAFVRRPDEWGPAGPPDPHPNRDYDIIVDDFDALQREVLARVA